MGRVGRVRRVGLGLTSVAYLPHVTHPDGEIALFNDSVFGEIVTPHCDIPVGVTALYFVNSEWRDEWDGETLFYAHGEAVSAVAMRPGRVVIFPGNMLHRAGVASRRCTVARRTLAYKFHTETIVP